MTSPAAPSLKVGGTLGEADLYIERPEDDAVYDTLARHEFVSILTSRQMGKSSLMVRVMRRLRTEQRARIATVDLAGGLGTPEDADGWYISLLDKVVLDLDLDCDVDAWWKARHGVPNAKLLQFCREIIGATTTEPIYIFIDEVDASLKLSFSDDLFTAIRSLYNQRSTVEEYRRITFCLIGVAAPGELIKERRTTPYNIGQLVELRDFDPARDDLSPLHAAMSQHGGDGERLVDDVLAHTGGHPFLTIALCASALARDACTTVAIDDLARELAAARTEKSLANHFESINYFLETRLRDKDRTFRVYRSVLRGRRVHDRVIAAHLDLRLSGLVKRDEEGFLRIRNPIYRHRFGLGWLKQQPSIKSQTRQNRIYLAMATVAIVSAITGAALWIGRTRSNVVSQDKLDAMMAMTVPEDAEEALDEICATVRNGAVITDRQLGDARAHVHELWRARAAPMEVKARSLRTQAKHEEALLLSARAAAVRGELPPEVWQAYQVLKVRPLLATFRGHKGLVEHVRALSNGRLVSVGSDDTIRLFDIEKQADAQTIPVDDLAPVLATCPQGDCVVTVAARKPSGANATPGAGTVWTNKLERVSTFAIPRPELFWSLALDTSASVPVVALGDDEGVLRVGRLPMLASLTNACSGGDCSTELVETSSYVHEIALKRYPVNAIRFRPAEKKPQVVTVAADIGVVDISKRAGTRTSIELARFGDRFPYSVDISPDGSRLAVAAVGVTFVTDWSGKILGSYGAAKRFHRAIFTGDDNHVLTAATSTEDRGLIAVWSVDTGKPSFVQATASPVSDVAPVVPGIVVSAHHDGMLRMWTLQAPSDEEPFPADLQALWTAWQHKFGLTVEGELDVVPFNSGGPRSVRGWRSDTCR